MSSPGHGVGPAHVWMAGAWRAGWSCSGRLKLEAGRTVISHEASIGSSCPVGRTKDYSWRRYLPRAKSSPASFIGADHSSNGPKKPMTDRLLAIGRPDAVPYLRTGGTHPARATVSSLPGKAAAIASAIAEVLAPLPPQLRRTITSTTGPSCHAIIGSMTWAYRPSSANSFPLAEGRYRERQRPLAAHSAAQDRLGGLARKSVYTADSGPQQYTAQVPGLQNPGRDNSGPCVALEM